MVWQAIADYELFPGAVFEVPGSFLPNERLGFFIESDPRPSEFYWRFSLHYRLTRSWGTVERPVYRSDNIYAVKSEVRFPAPPPENVGYNNHWLTLSVPVGSKLCLGSKLFVWRDV